MNGLLHWAWTNWLAVYPNLEASALAFGAGILVHHWRIGKKLERLYGHVDDLHGKVEALHVEVTGETADGRHAERAPRQ
jgi:hypothetical protein